MEFDSIQSNWKKKVGRGGAAAQRRRRRGRKETN
jgi:hypothetical protein